MRVGLIAMAGVRVRDQELAALGVTLPQFVNRGKVIATLPSLGLLTVAALTPGDVEVVYREVDELPPEGELEPFDLVGISSFTAMIEDAYLLADRYRAAGIPVVLGGLHVSLMPEEAAAHADAIVVNGAEGAWPGLIEDVRAGRLKSRYDGLRSGVFEPEHYAKPRFELLRDRPYNRITVQTSRGCPHDCEFCAASLRITSSYQQKPVERVIDEIETALEVKQNIFFELADDNTFVNRKWSKAFLKAVRPLGISWFTETDISVAEDDELLDLLAESGCKQILIGLESPNVTSLYGVDARHWKRRHFDGYLSAIERIQSRGVTVNGCFVVGLDGDTEDIFEQLRDYVVESKLLEVQITVPTPFPGTPLYRRLRAEGRLLQERFWDRCTLFDVNFQPKNMSVGALEAGLRWLFTEIYNDRELARRRRHYMEIVKRKTAPKPDSRKPMEGKMKRIAALAVTSLVMGLFLIPAPAVSAPPVIAVNCDSPNATIQNAVDFASGPTTIRFSGLCDEDVTIAKDDITLDGQDVGTVSGTINFDGAQRGVLMNATVTGPGVGVVANDGASVLIKNNLIDDNEASGIRVLDGAFARIVDNTITDNGRLDHFEAGIEVARAVARGQGNQIGNNAYAALSVFNFGSYRTGSFITPTQLDNDGPFEVIDVGAGTLAIEMGRMAFVDLRQVRITGDAFVGRQSMLQIRGDSGAPNLACSLFDGSLTGTGIFAQARLRFTHVTGTILGTVSGGSTQIGDCPNLP